MFIKIQKHIFKINNDIKQYFTIFDMINESDELVLDINSDIFQNILNLLEKYKMKNNLNLTDISTSDLIEILKVVDYLDIEVLFEVLAVDLSERLKITCDIHVNETNICNNIIIDFLKQLDN